MDCEKECIIRNECDSKRKECKITLSNMTEKIEKVQEDITDIKVKIAEIPGAVVKELKEHMQKTYVTKDSFLPVRIIAYGFVGIICIAVIAGLIELVIKN